MEEVQEVARTMGCWNLLHKACSLLTALMSAPSEESASHPLVVAVATTGPSIVSKT